MLSAQTLSYRKIINLSVPVILANIAMPIQGLIDVAIIGHLDRVAYLSAVGLATQLFALLFISFNFLQYASSGLSAQAKGQGDYGRLKRILLRALIIALVLGCILILFQWVWLRLGWWFFDIQPPLTNLVSQYFSIRIWGAPFELANYVFIGWFAGQGQPQAILRQQLVISLSNIVFNIIFVLVFDLNVLGVALGTLIANIIGFAYAISWVRRILAAQQEVLFSIDWKHLLKLDEVISLMRLNRDIMVRTMILTLAFAWITRLSSQQGEIFLAANIVLLQLLYFSSYAIDGVAVTTESLVGQAYGQKNMGLLQQVVRQTTGVALVIALLLSVLFFVVKPWLLYLLTDIEMVVNIANEYYVFAGLIPLVSVLAYQFDGVMFGLTANTTIRNSMLIVAVLFFPISYFLSSFCGNTGVWLSIYWFFILRSAILWWQFYRYF